MPWFNAIPAELSRIPRVNHIEIGEIDDTQIPAMKYRMIGHGFTYYLSTKNKFNKDVYNFGARQYCPEELGDNFMELEGHTFYMLVPPEKYYKEHPEYYSEIDGKRIIKNPVTGESAELCLTNPDVLKIATEGVRAALRNPEIDIMSVSQMDDTANYCRCANCRAIDEREGTPMGSILTFVNKIAEAIEKEFPDKKICTFSYTYSIKPPKTICPRKNVIIWVAPINACSSHPMEECEKNVKFKEAIEGWHKLGARLYILDYSANYRHYQLPFPNWGVLKQNVQFYVRNGVVGVYTKGDIANPEGLLRAYLLSRLFVDPDIDIDATENEFLETYYGKAAHLVRQYYDMLNDKVHKDNLHFGGGARPNNAGADGVSVPFNTLFTAEVISRAEKLFDEAEKLIAGDNEKLLHVQATRLGVWYFQIETMNPSDPKRSEIIARFISVTDKCPELGILSEGISLEGYKKRLKLETGLEKPSLEVSSVAAGDFDGDGSAEIVNVSTDGKSVIVLDYTSGADGTNGWFGWKLNNITGLGSATRGDNFVSVAAGDVDGDGKDEIIATGGRGGTPASGITVLKYASGASGPADRAGWTWSNITGLGGTTRPEGQVLMALQ